MITIAIKDHPGVDTAALAEAMQQQVAQLDEAWGVGEVNVVRYPKRKPKGAWRVQFYDELPPGMGGVHLGAKQPYAKVLASEGSVAASHEILEMLVDPAGTRFHAVGDRDYLVEVCDPVEATRYIISDVPVSDFVLPGWYPGGITKADEGTALPQLADFLGLIGPMGLMRNGYVSWIELGAWWQAFCDANGNITRRRLGLARQRTRREKERLAAR